jgi:hypothetical protein
VTTELYEKLQSGRKKYQAERTKYRLIFEKNIISEGIKEVGMLSKRELFLIGIALYWAEGFKHKDESSLGLATMDVDMANLYVSWLKECLGVENERLSFRVTANILYSSKINEMEKYWSDNLGVRIDQFVKPFYQKSKQNRVYPNSDKYFGVLRIRVRKSINILRKMRGWMAGMARAPLNDKI